MTKPQMTCTNCHEPAGEVPDFTALGKDAIDTLCSNWKCTGCLNEFDRLRANDAADRLRGTCQALYEVLPEEEQSPAVLSMLDDLVFKCEECGWWDDLSEQSELDHTRCRDCAGDNDNED